MIRGTKAGSSQVLVLLQQRAILAVTPTLMINWRKQS